MIFQNIKQLLHEHGVDFKEKVHAPTKTSEDSARVRGEKLSAGAKVIVLKVQDDFRLFVFPADRRIDNKKVKAYFKHHGFRVKRIRFASIDELMDLTGLVPGSVPPFGHPILSLPLYVDPSLSKNEIIHFNAGSLEHSLSIKYEDYIRIAQAELFDFIAA